MNLPNLVLVTALACTAAIAQGGQIWHINPANGHSYTLTSAMTWAQAESIAVQLGGHLATVRSHAENDWLVQAFYGPTVGGNYLWIGYSDVAQEGTWVWTSGEPTTFTNWAPGQPDNHSGIQNYAMIWDSPIGSWDDSQAATTAPGIVEAINTATFSTFGVACAGVQGPPSLASVPGSLPRFGSNFQLSLTNLPQGLAVALGALGFSSTSWQGIPLPRDLWSMGMPGCTQYVSTDFTYFTLSVGGTTTWTIPVPAIPSMAGFSFYVQALVPDSFANPFGATVTNAGVATIGG